MRVNRGATPNIAAIHMMLITLFFADVQPDTSRSRLQKLLRRAHLFTQSVKGMILPLQHAFSQHTSIRPRPIIFIQPILKLECVAAESRVYLLCALSTLVIRVFSTSRVQCKVKKHLQVKKANQMRARRVYKSQKQCIRTAPNHATISQPALLLILDARQTQKRVERTR